MKPSQIRVFDGLRLTSEHLEHLQQAMISAVRDLREIAGADRVYRGLDVRLVDGAVTVQPGLAFDAQKNRIVIDDPQIVTDDFKDGDECFVCIKYASVEDHEVQTHPTIVWDSGAVVTRPTLPPAEENLIALAKLVRHADGSKEVLPLQGASGTAADLPCMGVENLASASEGFDLREAILGQPRETAQWDEVLFDREIVAGADDFAIRCFVALSIEVAWKPDGAGADGGARRRMQLAAQGDVRVPPSGNTSHMSITTISFENGRKESRVSAEGVAFVTLAPLIVDLPGNDPVGSALKPIVLLVRVEPSGAGRFRLRGSVRFLPGMPAGRATGIERFSLTLNWDGQFGWSVCVGSSTKRRTP